MASPTPGSAVKKSVAEMLNGISIIFALLSGLLSHLATVGANTPELAQVISIETTGAAICAVISAALAFIGLFKR